MANLLLIDDDPDLLPEQVRHLFPPPHTESRSPTPARKGLKRVAASCRTSFSSTCACPTSPAWRS